MDFNGENTDNEKLANIFDKLPVNNVFEYTTASDIRMILNGGKSGIILFGTDNEWVNYYASFVNEVAEEYDINKVLYYDFLKNRSENNGTYEDIVNRLSKYAYVNDRGQTEIYAPTLVVIKDGEVLYFDSETSFVTGSYTPSSYWTDYKTLEKKLEFSNIFEKYVK
jgi:hypothetical protein